MMSGASALFGSGHLRTAASSPRPDRTALHEGAPRPPGAWGCPPEPAHPKSIADIRSFAIAGRRRPRPNRPPSHPKSPPPPNLQYAPTPPSFSAVACNVDSSGAVLDPLTCSQRHVSPLSLAPRRAGAGRHGQTPRERRGLPLHPDRIPHAPQQLRAKLRVPPVSLHRPSRPPAINPAMTPRPWLRRRSRQPPKAKL